MYDQLQHSVPWLITISGVLPVTTFCIILYWWYLYHTHISGPYLISGIRTTLTFNTIPYQWLCNSNILCHIWPVVLGLVIYSFFSFSPSFLKYVLFIYHWSLCHWQLFNPYLMNGASICTSNNILYQSWPVIYVPLSTFSSILGWWHLCH